jgi:surface antigen
MKRWVLSLICVLGILAIAAGCATRQQTGAVVGAGAGAGLGAAVTGGGTVGTLLGAVAGAAIGSEIGRAMDEEDRRRAATVLETVPTAETDVWRNPDSGYTYEMTPTRTFYAESGLPCREFSVDVIVGNQIEEAYGTACRQADGSWRIVE